ncbi:ANTAR domain-containing protein [Jannaschia sp. R86511]|uniref:ANTAR domain-containing protein n=1 Tax=Jannaschia sp. R86511 TaxID=3093853 RepID=UPI0036D2B3D3
MAELDDIVSSLLSAVMAAFRRDAADAVGVGVLVWHEDGTLDEVLSVLTDEGPDVVRALAGVAQAPHLVARRQRRVVRGPLAAEARAALDDAGLDRVRGAVALPTEWGRDGDCVLVVWLDREPAEGDVDLLARWEPMVVSSAVTAVTCRSAAEQVDELVDVLRARVVIEQAKGMVMARHRLPAEDAFELLREVSQRSNTPVRRLARAVVATATDARSDGDVAGDPAGRLAQRLLG